MATINEVKNFLREAAGVVPSERQRLWFDMGLYGFVHFGVNTFTGREWGTGSEDPAVFNPERLDCDQWVRAAKSAGMKGLILTAKHHDGFCLWPSKYTEHSVKNSPFKGDVVRELSEACKRGGIKFGFYLSPWDRNSALYGTDSYNDYYKAQLTELLTGYGDIFMVWFDGACGEGPNGKKQVYDFKGYIDLVRKYQPSACMFNDAGPDVRWVGNESGTARLAEWAVVPRELTHFAEVQTGPMPMYTPGALSHVYNTQPELGVISNILTSGGLCFCPSETDMSIRPGWFWHESEEPHSLERLKNTYITSVGGNSALNLNIPPDRSGLIDSRDVKRLGELGAWLDSELSVPLSASVARNGNSYEIDLGVKRALRYIELREDLAYGQRVESYLIDMRDSDGIWQNAFAGTTIGNRRIVPLNCETDKLRLRITFARAEERLRVINIYGT